MRRTILGATLLLAVCVPHVGAAKDETILISRQSAAAGNAGADASASREAVSGDGRYVAFQSGADNLSADDDNSVENVFVRDTQTNTTILVSRQSATDGSAAANGGSSSPSISATGRYVAFVSGADNLSTADDNATENIFVRDLQANTTALVSRESGAGGAGADDLSFHPSISGDGRFVAFQSFADNLSTIDDNSQASIFVRDLQAESTVLVSRQSDPDGGAAANGFSSEPFISADGRFVAFESDADNLSTADNDSVVNVYLRELQTQTTTLVSRQSAAEGGTGATGNSSNPAVSGDGRFVAFESSAANLSSIDNDPAVDVFVRDLQGNATVLASRQSAAAGGAGADTGATEPSLSADGRFVVFESAASNLTDADVGFGDDVFVRDLQAQTTTLVSRQSAAVGGGAGDDESQVSSQNQSVSADGRFVAFASDADNLSAEDANAFRNLFLRDVLGPPSGGGDGGGNTTDTKPPTLDLTAKKKQTAGKPLKLTAKSDETCALSLTGSAKPKGEKKGKLKPVSDQLAAGIVETLKLKPKGKLKQALAEADKGKAKVAGACTDAAGNPSQDALKVKLK